MNGDLNIEAIFSGNVLKEKKVIKGKNWDYEGYGQILSISPVIIDFGDFELNVGNWINDHRVIGEYVFWKIERLDIGSMNNL